MNLHVVISSWGGSGCNPRAGSHLNQKRRRRSARGGVHTLMVSRGECETSFTEDPGSFREQLPPSLLERRKHFASDKPSAHCRVGLIARYHSDSGGSCHPVPARLIGCDSLQGQVRYSA